MSLKRKDGAHLGALQCRLQFSLGRKVDDHNGVDDEHGRNDGHHHCAEHGEAEVLLAPLRGILNLWHDRFTKTIQETICQQSLQAINKIREMTKQHKVEAYTQANLKPCVTL